MKKNVSISSKVTFNERFPQNLDVNQFFYVAIMIFHKAMPQQVFYNPLWRPSWIFSEN